MSKAIYLYDGTFDGFLTCVYEHYYSAGARGICPPGAYQPDMLARVRETPTDETKAEKVEAAIRDRISPYALARIYRVFRTSTEGKEMALLNYIRFCFKCGPGAAFLHTHPIVNPINAAELKIGNEVHRLCGLIRFSVVTAADAYGAAATAGGAEGPRLPAARSGAEPAPEVLYARVSPDHEVLEFLAPHFTDRFKNDPFIIHDTKRNKALIALHKRWHIADFTERDAQLFNSSASEKAYRDLWRGYFQTIAIKERKNSRCQRNLMPARYWQYLPEMQL
jgi:probable DNA metabolism protein